MASLNSRPITPGQQDGSSMGQVSTESSFFYSWLIFGFAKGCINCHSSQSLRFRASTDEFLQSSYFARLMDEFSLITSEVIRVLERITGRTLISWTWLCRGRSSKYELGRYWKSQIHGLASGTFWIILDVCNYYCCSAVVKLRSWHYCSILKLCPSHCTVLARQYATSSKLERVTPHWRVAKLGHVSVSLPFSLSSHFHTWPWMIYTYDVLDTRWFLYRWKSVTLRGLVS
jgi:hypothetical protein